MLNYKEIQTIIAIITEDKVTELFCMTDDFCKFFDALMKKYTMKSDTKRQALSTILCKWKQNTDIRGNLQLNPGTVHDFV